MRLELSDRFVAAAKPRTGEIRTDYFDALTPGLALRVSDTGVKSWSYSFTSPKDDKRARLRLGSYPSCPLARARALAREAGSHVEQHNDPRDIFAAESGSDALTVGAVVELYLGSRPHERARGMKSVEKIRSRMKRYVIPMIGATKVAKLTKDDVTLITGDISKCRKRSEANRVYQNLRAVFRYAVRKGKIPNNPLEGMSKPCEEEARDRNLSFDEIRIVWQALDDAFPLRARGRVKGISIQRIVQLCFVLGQRIGEISGMEVRELDLKARVWTLPKERTKNYREHIVPLSPLACSIIREALKDAGDGARFVFPDGDGSVRPCLVAKRLEGAQRPTSARPQGSFPGVEWFTCHDARRSMVTRMTDDLDVFEEVAGAVCNHVNTKTVTGKHYNRAKYLRQKTAALNTWSVALQNIIDGNVDALPVAVARLAA